MTGKMYECHVHGIVAGDHCRQCEVKAFFPPPAKITAQDLFAKFAEVKAKIPNFEEHETLAWLDFAEGIIQASLARLRALAAEECGLGVRPSEEFELPWSHRKRIKTAAQAQDVIRRAGFATGDTARSLVDHALRAQMPPDDHEDRVRTEGREAGVGYLNRAEHIVVNTIIPDNRDGSRDLEIADCPDCRKAAAHAYSDATTPGFFYTECEKHRQAGIGGAAGVVITQEMTIEEAKRRFPNWSPERWKEICDAESEALDGTGGLLAVSPEIYAEMQKPVTLNIPERYPWDGFGEKPHEEKADEGIATGGGSPSGVQQRHQGSDEAAGVAELERSREGRGRDDQAESKKAQALKIPGVTTATEMKPKLRVTCPSCGGHGKHRSGCKVKP